MEEKKDLQGKVIDTTGGDSPAPVFEFPDITIDPIDEADFDLLGGESTEGDDDGEGGNKGGKTPEYSAEADQDAIATYETWVEKGLIPESEDFDGTFENLEKLTEAIPTIVQNALIGKSPKQGQDIVNYILTKGEDLKLEELDQFLKLEKEANSVGSMEAFTASEDARNYLFDKYTKTTALEEDVIDAMIDKLEEKGSDQILAKANELLTADKAAADAAKVTEQGNAVAATKARQDALDTFNAEVVTTLNELDWSKDKVQTIQTEYNTGVTQKKFDAVLGDAKTLPHLINFFTHYNIETKTFDFTGFAKAASTKEVKEIKKKMFGDKFKSSIHTSKSKSTPAQKEFNMDDYIVG